ncbi:hypothetical protein SAMN04489713_11935 [Actinomadura madurae]|uniref:Uncharacterized protein n=1 Tax=Actinomadura madurae TaxID=1993 RepID=A0A1I5U4R4_9ACTN|nr:hypothetical protein [Actinomadura madurae]SFP90272.1 hypothetical protein SAMN04489713_11935 [Actinomadura madurae]
MTHIPEAWYDRPTQARAAPAPSPSARPVGRLELDLDIDRALDDLHRAFPGICIWHGEFSGSFWALLPDRLVEARTAADLARRLRAAVSRPRPRVRSEPYVRHPRPSTRRADGTWTTARSATRRPTQRGRRARRVVRWLLTTCLHLAPAAPLP